MKEIVLPIIIDKKSLLAKAIVYVLICLWAMTLILQFEKDPHKDIFLFVSVGLTLGIFTVGDLTSIASRGKVPVYDSSLQITGSGIRIRTEEAILDYSLEELDSVTLTINETSFDPDPKGFIDMRKTGTGNWVEIRVVDGTYYKYRIYIDSADEIEKLDLFLEQVQEKKIIVKRGGVKVTSIKKAHYTDIPTHYRETRRSKR